MLYVAFCRRGTADQTHGVGSPMGSSRCAVLESYLANQTE